MEQDTIQNVIDAFYDYEATLDAAALEAFNKLDPLQQWNQYIREHYSSLAPNFPKAKPGQKPVEVSA